MAKNLFEKFKIKNGDDEDEEEHRHDGDPWHASLVLVVAALAGPFAVQFFGKITAVVAGGLFLLRRIEAGLVVKLSRFGFVEIEQGHSCLFLKCKST